MNSNSQNIIYCDANFLVAIFAKSTTDQTRQIRAQKLYASLLAQQCRMVASPLTFDEFWNGVRKEIGYKPNSHTATDWAAKIESLWRKYFPSNYKNFQSNYSYNEASPQITTATNILINHTNFKIVQLIQEKAGIQRALSFLAKLRPQDAFHLTVALQNGVTHMVTNDKVLANEV